MRCILAMCLIMTVLFACKKKSRPVPHYTISKVFKSDTLTTVNVHIDSRVSGGELLSIAEKVKKDSLNLTNLEIHYLLPGNADLSAGDNSYYAAARYIKENEAKPADTIKDDDGNVVRMRIFGISKSKADQLLALKPKEVSGKNVLGRFIDDYNHTVIIPFKDMSGKRELYVIEIDSSAKIVSATMPLKKIEDGVEKWLVTQNGDYITIKDNVLTQYAADGLGVPFNSIKSGI